MKLTDEQFKHWKCVDEYIDKNHMDWCQIVANEKDIQFIKHYCMLYPVQHYSSGKAFELLMDMNFDYYNKYSTSRQSDKFHARVEGLEETLRRLMKCSLCNKDVSAKDMDVKLT